MRNIESRLPLPSATARHLSKEAAIVDASSDKKSMADKRYKVVRQLIWFRKVTETLSLMAGAGQRCMYCSGSESAQVEHYRPKAIHPEHTFAWENLIWSCGICNQIKSNRFNENVRPINPVDDNVWSHFFIDQFGNLSPRWNPDENALDSRAVESIKLHGLDRQALQESRYERLIDLRSQVRRTLNMLESGGIGPDEIQETVLNWIKQPFQSDVADYFLSGPGRIDPEEPFKSLIDAMNNQADA
jgi:uncharacterized protein (TIGR02646 family)